MTDTQRIAIVVGYVAIWIFASAVMQRQVKNDSESGDMFISAVIAFFWPLGLAVLVIASPFLLVGWIASILPGVKR